MVELSGYFESYINYLPILFVVIWLYWTRIVGGPWVPSSLETVHRMLKIAELKPEDVVVDLGCGDGRMVLTAARHYGVKAAGIEIDPLRYLWCQFLVTILFRRKQVHIVFGNIFNVDLSEADVVMVYLLPEANKKLEAKFRKELKPGARIVSNRYPFSGLELLQEDGDVRLYQVNLEETIKT